MGNYKSNKQNDEFFGNGPIVYIGAIYINGKCFNVVNNRNTIWHLILKITNELKRLNLPWKIIVPKSVQNDSWELLQRITIYSDTTCGRVVIHKAESNGDIVAE
jgi:hypothetical protein